MIELVGLVAAGLGVFFMLISALGLLWLPDFYLRIHAPTKAATLGPFFLVLAYISSAGPEGIHFKSLLILLFISCTIPIGAQIISRAAYRSRLPLKRPLTTDAYAAPSKSKQESRATEDN